ncbi:MAG: alpha-L-fucosidase, partial [Candidatus Theseobacter exili]|nr:alpha-L-fucosidase [Candidatus Theseobacter exili]
ICRTLQPGIIINDRLDLMDVPGGWDVKTPEQTMVRKGVEYNGKRVPWETCQTFSGSWGYHREQSTWKSVKQLLFMLIDTVSKGGNLLLNVGPTARGIFDNRAMDRLNGIGEWMKLHNRSIYGCTEAPAGFKCPDNCILTYNPTKKRIYVNILNWPLGRLYLDGYKGKVKYAQLLNDASEIQFSGLTDRDKRWVEDKKTLSLQLPTQKPDVVVPVIELFLK